MRLVIEIPEDVKAVIDRNGTNENVAETLWQAIKNGTPLPKVYGDLVDRGRVIDLLNEQEYNYYTELDKVVDTVYEAEAIIEADKGEQE